MQADYPWLTFLSPDSLLLSPFLGVTVVVGDGSGARGAAGEEEEEASSAECESRYCVD